LLVITFATISYANAKYITGGVISDSARIAYFDVQIIESSSNEYPLPPDQDFFFIYEEDTQSKTYQYEIEIINNSELAVNCFLAITGVGSEYVDLEILNDDILNGFNLNPQERKIVEFQLQITRAEEGTAAIINQNFELEILIEQSN